MEKPNYNSQKDSTFTNIGELIENHSAFLDYRQDIDGIPGIPSGYPSIDCITQGWQNGTLIVIGSRPSVGKTAFALNIARNAAVDHHVPVAYFSLGMNNEHLAERLIVTESGIPMEKMTGGVKMDQSEWDQYDMTLKRLYESPIYFDDTPDLSDKEFEERTYRIVKDKGVRLIIIDSIQMMRGPEKLRDNRIQETAEIVRNLKRTAMRLDIPVIAVSQLSRDNPRNYGSHYDKPRADYLRDSGVIENIADMIIFIHRPDFENMSEDPADKEKAVFIIAKNNAGPTPDIEMRFKENLAKFVEPDKDLNIMTTRVYVSAASEAPAPDYTPVGYSFENNDTPF